MRRRTGMRDKRVLGISSHIFRSSLSKKSTPIFRLVSLLFLEPLTSDSVVSKLHKFVRLTTTAKALYECHGTAF